MVLKRSTLSSGPAKSAPSRAWPKWSVAPASSALFSKYTLSSYRDMLRLNSLSSLPYRWKTREPSFWCMTRPVTRLEIACMSRTSPPPSC